MHRGYKMEKIKAIRLARKQITRLIKVADRFIFSVYDTSIRNWVEYGPYEYEQACKERKAILSQMAVKELEKS